MSLRSTDARPSSNGLGSFLARGALMLTPLDEAMNARFARGLLARGAAMLADARRNRESRVPYGALGISSLAAR